MQKARNRKIGTQVDVKGAAEVFSGMNEVP